MPPQIVGVLNVTPDSFYDGGKHDVLSSALVHAQELLAEGAAILEVGGESTGPKSVDVSESEEIKRTIPVIKEILLKWPKTKISVDTWKSAVAREAIAAGAQIINDVTAGRSDPELFSVVATGGAELVLMFSKDATPRTTIAPAEYKDVIQTISDFLVERRSVAIAAGIKNKKIILDPGLGHYLSSTPDVSMEVLARLPELLVLGAPIFISASRKSFLAGVEKLLPQERLPGTIAASTIAVLNGATYIRTHDVAAVRRACEVAHAVRSKLR